MDEGFSTVTPRAGAQSFEAPDFTLRQLSYLVTAADAGSLAAAAQRLHVSAPSLSQALTQLDMVFGEQLTVRRKSHGVTLTPAGARVVAEARLLLAHAGELQRASMLDAAGALSGPIVVGCFPSLAVPVQPELHGVFAAAHPGIDLQIIEVAHDEVEDLIASGAIDVAFLYDVLVPPRLERRELFQLPSYALVAAGHPLAKTGTATLAQLADEPLVLYDATPAREYSLAVFERAGIVPDVRYAVSSFEVMRSMVARGLGYALAARWPVLMTTADGLDLARIDLVPEPDPITVELVWAPRRRLPARILALIDFAGTVDWVHPVPADASPRSLS